jgi:hypothetical protein
MMQALKLEEGKIEKMSKYDPLDLFSGEYGRIQQAIRSLIDDPQYNFRLSILNREMVGVNSRFNAGEIKTTLFQGFDIDDPVEELTKILATVICDSGVMNEIRKLQELDNYDIESVCAIFRHLSEPLSFSMEAVRENASCKYLPHASTRPLFSTSTTLEGSRGIFAAGNTLAAGGGGVSRCAKRQGLFHPAVALSLLLTASTCSRGPPTGCPVPPSPRRCVSPGSGTFPGMACFLARCVSPGPAVFPPTHPRAPSARSEGRLESLPSSSASRRRGAASQ